MRSNCKRELEKLYPCNKTQGPGRAAKTLSHPTPQSPTPAVWPTLYFPCLTTSVCPSPLEHPSLSGHSRATPCPRSPSASANHSIDGIMCVASACPNFLKYFSCFPLLQGGNPVTWLARPRLTLLGSPLLSGGSAPSCIGPQHKCSLCSECSSCMVPLALTSCQGAKIRSLLPVALPSYASLPDDGVSPPDSAAFPNSLGFCHLKKDFAAKESLKRPATHHFASNLEEALRVTELSQQGTPRQLCAVLLAAWPL